MNSLRGRGIGITSVSLPFSTYRRSAACGASSPFAALAGVKPIARGRWQPLARLRVFACFTSRGLPCARSRRAGPRDPRCIRNFVRIVRHASLRYNIEVAAAVVGRLPDEPAATRPRQSLTRWRAFARFASRGLHQPDWSQGPMGRSSTSSLHTQHRQHRSTTLSMRRL